MAIEIFDFELPIYISQRESKEVAEEKINEATLIAMKEGRVRVLQEVTDCTPEDYKGKVVAYPTENGTGVVMVSRRKKIIEQLGNLVTRKSEPREETTVYRLPDQTRRVMIKSTVGEYSSQYLPINGMELLVKIGETNEIFGVIRYIEDVQNLSGENVNSSKLLSK